MRILALLAMMLPGLAWWAWLGRRDKDWLISLAEIIGVSLAIILLMAEAVFLLGRTFSRGDVLLILGGFAVVAIAGIIKRGVMVKQIQWHKLIIGLLLIGLVIGWRLYQSRNLLLPNWVDSQHHYLIIRVILENGGLPEDLMPYLPMPFYYHYGFHALTALFTTLSGFDIGRAMIVLGQILNALIGLSIYALGKALWDDWRPALGAALLVSFVTRMPAYYLSWGRYTLTTGLIFTPLAMRGSLRLLRKNWHKWDVLTLCLLTSGVLLSHYFAAFLLAIFMILLGIVHILWRLGRLRSALMQLARVISGAASGLLLTAPWLWRLAQFSPNNAEVSTNLPESLEVAFNADLWQYTLRLLGPASNRWLLLPAGIGLLVSLIKPKSNGFGLWSLILTLLSLPLTISLKPFRPDHFTIILFVPVVLWASFLFWQIGRLAAKSLKLTWLSAVLILLPVAGWMVWSFPLSSDIINPVTVLVTDADMEALDWVVENTPPDARFFINTTHWLSNVYRGVDGGGWLLPYTGRWSLVPTVFYGFSPNVEYSRPIRAWGERASEVTTCSDDFWMLVEEANLDWVYLREGVGILKPETLDGCPGLERVYTNSSVVIYQISQIETPEN